MKLYLSSYRIPDPGELSKLIGKSLNEVSVALIPSAKDYYSKRAKDFKTQEVVRYFEEFGMSVHVVDLAQLQGEELKSNLSNKDLVWVMGGNTYVLREEMQKSGFDSLIKDILGDSVVFGGESAGALIACPSIAGIESADEPAFAEKKIERGLGLVEFEIMPHADNPDFADAVTEFKLHHSDKEVVKLNDSQALVIDGEDRVIIENPAQVE